MKRLLKRPDTIALRSAQIIRDYAKKHPTMTVEQVARRHGRTVAWTKLVLKGAILNEDYNNQRRFL